MRTKDEKPEELDPFARVVHEIDRTEVEPRRHLSVQMDLDVRAMIRAAQESGQSASVTIKLVAKRKGDMIEVSGASTAKLPKPAAGTVRLYADDEGELFNHNPSHAASALPGVSVETPPRRRQAAPVETPINAAKRGEKE